VAPDAGIWLFLCKTKPESTRKTIYGNRTGKDENVSFASIPLWVQQVTGFLAFLMGLTRTWLAWILTVSVLCGQTAVLAHEFGHDFQLTGDPCVECLTQNVFDGAFTSDFHTFATLHEADRVFQYVENVYHSACSHQSLARAPPLSRS